MATKHDITIDQRSTFVLVITVVGGPADMAGATCDMQIRKYKSSAETLADIGLEDFTVDALNRQIVLELTDEQTMAMDWTGAAVYDLYVEDADGERWRVIEGTARLSKTVTQGV